MSLIQFFHPKKAGFQSSEQLPRNRPEKNERCDFLFMKALVWGFHVQGSGVLERLLSSVQPDGVRSRRSRAWRTPGSFCRYTLYNGNFVGKHIKHC